MSTLQERLRGRVVQRWIHSKGTSPHASGVKPDELCAEAADRLDELEREVEALRVDAERMRWIAAHCRRTAEHWGGRWSIVIDGPAPVRHDEEDALYAAIDAARSKT